MSRADDVEEALSSAALTVALPHSLPVTDDGGHPATGDPVHPVTTARGLQGRMARFSDGSVHQARRDRVLALLPDAGATRQSAREMTSAELAGQHGPVEAMDLARRMPVAVLARALGVPAGRALAVAADTGALCAALAPAAAPAALAGGDQAAAALLTALAGPVGLSGSAAEDRAVTDRAVAVVSVLFQAHDAMAALIGLALEAMVVTPLATPAELVDRALRDDPPVQCTRRTTVTPAVISGVTIPAGAAVWLLLAAAEHGAPWPPATFGAGPHACPGRELATALAQGVLLGLLDDGWEPVTGPGGELGYEPRPNLRMPRSAPICRR
ncbi:MAG: hypothetical protein ABJB47_20285 [Actinomycetota bacterium]